MAFCYDPCCNPCYPCGPPTVSACKVCAECVNACKVETDSVTTKDLTVTGNLNVSTNSNITGEKSNTTSGIIKSVTVGAQATENKVLNNSKIKTTSVVMATLANSGTPGMVSVQVASGSATFYVTNVDNDEQIYDINFLVLN